MTREQTSKTPGVYKTVKKVEEVVFSESQDILPRGKQLYNSNNYTMEGRITLTLHVTKYGNK